MLTILLSTESRWLYACSTSKEATQLVPWQKADQDWLEMGFNILLCLRVVPEGLPPSRHHLVLPVSKNTRMNIDYSLYGRCFCTDLIQSSHIMGM